MKKAKFGLPPSPIDEAHKKVMKRLRAMTPEELAQTVVRAGICTERGTLTKAYGGTAKARPPASVARRFATGNGTKRGKR